MDESGRQLDVLVVAADQLARAGLAAIAGEQEDVRAAGSGAPADAATLIDALAPDLVVWDLGWDPDEAGFAALAECSGDGPPVLVLAADAAAGRGARLAGAAAIVSRDSPPASILAALQTVALGLFVASPELLEPVERTQPRGEGMAEPLTPRELEVLQLVADGLANKGIALRLELSEHTVKHHIDALMSKLGAQSRTEAVVSAIRQGLITV